MEGEGGNLAAITLYLEGIVKFSRLRQGEKSLIVSASKHQEERFLLFLNQQWNLQQNCDPRAICHVIVLPCSPTTRHQLADRVHQGEALPPEKVGGHGRGSPQQ